MVAGPPPCDAAAVSRRAWILFAAVSLLWGVPYLLIKVCVEDGVPPAFLAWARVTLAAVVLVPLAWRSGRLGALRTRWRWVALFAVVEIVVPLPLIAFGETHVSSSLAAILVSSLPLVIATIALGFDPEERVGGLRLAGLGVGLLGVIALLGIDVAGSADELLGSAAILVAVVGYALGPMILKHRLVDLDPLGPIAGAMLVASVVLAPAALVAPPDAVPDGGTLAAIVALGLLCTALAFLLMFSLIADVGPSRASVITYVNPLIAVVLGVALLGEPVTAGAVAGLLLILAGSWLATGGRPPTPGRRRSVAAVQASAG